MNAALIAFICLWFTLAFLLFLLAPYELQLRGARSSSFHWLGLPIRRARLDIEYENIRVHLLDNEDYRACDIDGDMLVLTLNFLRVTVLRAPRGSELIFRFPIGLVAFFVVFGWASITISSQFPAESLLEWAAVTFLVCFMTGLPLLVWRLLHTVAVEESTTMLNDISRLTRESSSTRLETQGTR